MNSSDKDLPISVFAELGLSLPLVETLAELGYEEPTPIQQEAVPALLAGEDLMGQAATGTGKTAAFALPMLHQIGSARGKTRSPRGLVLVPTRELAIQVAEAMQRYGQRLGARVLSIYGGQPFPLQTNALSRGVDVVVATPGRALDHLRRGTLDLSAIATVVLDEADEMLDMGFLEDIDAILSETPAERQTVMFSATLPSRVTAVANRHLKDPKRIRIAATKNKSDSAPTVRQTVYIVPHAQKVAALGRLMDLESPTSAIVFCRTRLEVDDLVTKLSAHGHAVEALHGGMSQVQRDRVMKRLRSAEADLVVATDVAARGLDVDRLTHVFNFDVPAAPETYVHRIGRVGRAGRGGVAITLAEPRQRRLLRNIETASGERLELGQLPTLADMQARRLDLLRASLREVIVEGNLDRYRNLIEPLSAEFDAFDIAAAALKLADKASPGEAEEEEAERQAVARATEPMVRLFLAAGRQQGIRPQNVVGAITGETKVSARDIGAIEITDRFTLVEIRQSLTDLVITALNATTIQGQKVSVRLDRHSAEPATPQRGPKKAHKKKHRLPPRRRG